MRHALAVGILLASATAAANPKAVQATVKTSIVELGNLRDNDVLGFDSDAIVIDPAGLQIEMSSEDGCVSGAVANSFYGCNQASFTHKPGAISVGVDGGIAWFQAPFTVEAESDDPDSGKPSRSTSPMRFGGIAVGTGASWKIVAAMYTAPISDKELLKGTGGKPASGEPKLAGDKKLAGVVAGWFKTGFAPNAAKKGTLLASGTAPSEFKAGAAATKLAATWDKLELGATSVEAKLLAGGKIGWVTAQVTLPRKNGKGAVELKLAAIVVSDGDSWRWVSLQYQSPNR